MTLSVKHISKYFGGNEVLKDVSIEVKKGEILSLMGESGCGKSTLLRIISGLEVPDQGTITLNDEDITTWKPEKRKFGFVFQNLSLFPHLSVRGNIFYAVRGKEKTNLRLEKLLRMTGLDGLDGRFPHELSGGQQQRVALARVLAINPQLLMLDEPFSSLDTLLKTKIREEIFDLLRSLQITTIHVSHDASDAFLISDKLVVLRHGEVQQTGTPSEVYEKPISSYVSNFFGTSVILKGKNSSDNMFATPFGSFKIGGNHTGDFQLFVRPENIQITSEHDFNLSGRVLRKEFKGPHDVLKIGNDSDDESIILETERCSVNVNDIIYLKVPEEKIQIFK